MPDSFRSEPEMATLRKFLANRSQLPPPELIEYAGQWIMWSVDGSRIVAHAGDPAVLDELVRQAGEDPEHCILEGIPSEDTVLGGGILGQTRP
jgi:hypothetical protein